MRRHLIMALAATALYSGICMAQNAPAPLADDSPPSLMDELRAGFFSRVNVFGFVLYQQPADTLVNYVNALSLPRSQAELDVRPDLNLKWRQFELDLKPRMQWSRNRTLYVDVLQFDSHQRRIYLNEGSLRYRLADRLILSYGRENVQWGPSMLLSPSNPFNASNGRNNPNLELPGLDYARAIYVASPALTISLIDNTSRGRLDPVNHYRKAAAAKIDYTGDGHFVSVVLSHAQGEGNRIGAFAGWDVSDALSVHAEGSVGQNREGLPARRPDRELLVGATYTLEYGATLSGEYFHRDNGCTGMPAQACLLLRGAFVDPVRPLIRRRYSLLQYADTKIAGKLNLALRLVNNLDDHSAQLLLNLEYELGDHWQLYAIPTLYRGSRDSEFGSLLHRSLFVGASYTF